MRSTVVSAGQGKGGVTEARIGEYFKQDDVISETPRKLEDKSRYRTWQYDSH